jgi:TadE-like protein
VLEPAAPVRRRSLRPSRAIPRGLESSRGQSLVEFTLFIPILLMLFVGVADFGRVFNAGVVLEAVARDSAEHAAQKYLANPPGDPTKSAAERFALPVPAAVTSYYTDLRDDAGRTACAEMRALPNTDAGGTCTTWPVVAVCVHDGADPACGATPTGFPSIPAECGDLAGGWTNAAGGNGERWVEVRVCYRFTTLLPIKLIQFNDIYLQRTRSFPIACYFATGFGGCS